jgi:hypothetical protein
MRLILDIEANNLLGPALDYSQLPFKLKEDFRIWCAVIRNVDTGAVRRLYGSELTAENISKSLSTASEIIGHNIVGYDLPVMQLYGLLTYRIGYPGEPSTINSKPIIFTDTLLWSKLLNADRLGGHSLEAWGRRLGNNKTYFEEWDRFSEEMLEYCVQDTSVNKSILEALEKEKAGTAFDLAYSMEIKLADLTLRQELFGFELDTVLAYQNINFLESTMQDIAAKVNPLLPPKKLGKTAVKAFMPPKKQFKSDGSLSALMLKFIEKHDLSYNAVENTVVVNGEITKLPLTAAVKTEEPATIEDIDVVKGYLLSLGWVPSEIKERDLLKKTDKTQRNSVELKETIERYVEQTSESLFQNLRCEALDTNMLRLKSLLLSKIEPGKQRPIYVPTTPTLTVGVEKEICPNLVALGKKAEFVGDVVKYYTYRHRKNSIAGGVLDEDGEPITGFLSAIREDGRVPTPADTLGANTGRYRHKIVCNIPRVTSLFGAEMRNMFRAGKGLWQLGYDFASLEARVMGHYVLPYTDGETLAEALIAEKPNDIHTINAKKLGIERSAAKSFSYASIYGAQPKKLAKMLGITESEAKILFNAYWDAVPALKELKAAVEKSWENNGKKYIRGLDGRRLSTRSKHSLVNVLFQSGGAIAAKWSAVRMAQDMERLNILGDPFLHSKADVKCWWMIHMHDEQQMACHPKLMNVKSFPAEDSAEAAKVKGCSAVGHGSKGAYLGFETEPVQCIAKGIEQACAELNLRVDLGFEWIPGLSWGQCH